MHKVLIWDSVQLYPSSGFGSILLWRSFGDKNCSNIISIPQLIEANSDSLRSRYLAWVYELGELRIKGKRLVDHLQLRPGFSYWWMTLLSEKANYSKSPQITDAISLLAFSDWASNKTLDSVTLVSTNQALADCLSLWCEKSGAAFKWEQLAKQTASSSFIRRAYDLLPTAMRALIFLMHYLINRWALRGVGLDEWRNSAGQITFVSYLDNLLPAAVTTGQYESRYWGHLPEVLKDESVQTNWLHLYVKNKLVPSAKHATILLSAFNQNEQGNRCHVTLDSFISLKAVVRIIYDYIWLTLLRASLDSDLNYVGPDVLVNLWPLFRNDWHKSMGGDSCMSNLLNLILFESAIKNLPKQLQGLYLQENQGWEFGFIHAWQSFGHGTLVGVPHSTVRFWDLRYFFDTRSYVRTVQNDLPIPNIVACNGPVACSSYVKGGYPIEYLFEVEALRYLYLARIDLARGSKRNRSNNVVRLLVFGDSLPSITQLQLKLLVEALALLSENFEIIIKPHPNCPLDFSDYPSLNLQVINESVENLLCQCDIAYSSGVSSAALDAYLFGVPIVMFLDPSILSLSPLRGFVGPFFVSTSQELARSLIYIVSNKQMESYKPTYFRLDLQLSNWKRLLL